MFKMTKVGLASVAAGAILAVGGSTAVAAPLAAPLRVTASHAAVPMNGYPSSTGHCVVYPATITAGGYVAFVCKGFYPGARVRIKGPFSDKLRHAGRHGRILIVLHLKHAGLFTLSATGNGPHGTGPHHVSTFRATVTVLPS